MLRPSSSARTDARAGKAATLPAISLRSVVVVVGLLAASGGCFSPDRAPGDGSDTDTSSAGGDGSSGSGDAAPLSCPQYCTLVGDHCDGDLLQYPGSVECEAMCAGLPVGAIDDTLGNTRGCRAYHASNAIEDPAGHCRHAGPSGDGVCGGNCESFCTLAAALCTDENQVFANSEDCVTQCGQYPVDPPYSADLLAGDSFACRMFHLSVAALQPSVHCGHIGLVSDTCF